MNYIRVGFDVCPRPKVTAPLVKTIELAFTSRPAKRSQMLFLAGNTNKALCSLFRRYTPRFGRTECNTFRDLKCAMEETTEI